MRVARTTNGVHSEIASITGVGLGSTTATGRGVAETETTRQRATRQFRALNLGPIVNMK